AQDHMQGGIGEVLYAVAAPLHDCHGAVEIGFEVEVVDLALAAEPVGVHVHQIGPVAEAGMDPFDDEGGRGDRAPHPQAVAEPLGEGGLAGAERAVEHEQVPGPQRTGQGAGDGPGALGVAREDLVGAHDRTFRVTRPETEVSTSEGLVPAAAAQSSAVEAEGPPGSPPASPKRNTSSPGRASESAPRSMTIWSMLMRPTCGARRSPEAVRTSTSQRSLPARCRPSA